MQSLQHLGIDHLQPLRRARMNFLSAPISEFTYAQIIDGQPTSDVYAADHYFRDGLAVTDHEELCPGSIEKARAFRADFNVLELIFEANVSTEEKGFTDLHHLITWLQTLEAYQDTLPGSIAWKLRLLELVASACHDIAVHLYQMDAGAIPCFGRPQRRSLWPPHAFGLISLLQSPLFKLKMVILNILLVRPLIYHKLPVPYKFLVNKNRV